MTVDAGSGLEYPLPLGNNITGGRRLPLLLDPAVELIVRLNINTQEHFGVLCPAILRALAEVNARLVRIDPHTIRVVRNQVRLTCQPWPPETMVRISGQQLDESRRWVPRVAHRHVQFVCSNDVQSGIAIFPPKLVADSDNFDGIGGGGGRLGMWEP